jgi:4-hydroxybenzoate polyprenyltransferase
MKIVQLFSSLRPSQWTKNLIIFAGLIFSENLLNPTLFIYSFIAFILFCFISGAVYIINDIIDKEQDRLHPAKSQRPIASGKVKTGEALFFSLIIIVIAVPASFYLEFNFGLIASIYLAVMILYSLGLKRIIILDVMIISLGFVIRAIAGALVIKVTISSWLLICTTFLALFLALGKRRHELALLEDDAPHHRKQLASLTPRLLDQMISIATAGAIISYSLYTMSEETVSKFGPHLIYTLPFVLYGILRYLYLIYKEGLGGNPSLILIKDKPLLINVALWIITAGIIVYLKI